MTRIVHLASVDLPHRKARAIQITNTAHALARSGARVTLVGGRRSRHGDHAVLAPYGLTPHPNLRLVRLPILRPPSWLDRWYTRIWQASYLLGVAAISPKLLSPLPDAILVRDLRLAWMLCRMGTAIQSRIVYEAHDLSSLEAELRGDMTEASRLRTIETEVFASAGRVVCITSELARLITERYPRERRRPIVIADGTSSPTREAPAPTARADVYYVGQLYPWKGVDTLMRAAALNPHIRHMIVGGAEEPGAEDRDIARLAALAQSLGITESVTFTGWVPYHRVPSILRDAAVTVIPLPDTPFGRYFTSPLKLFDYMAAATPIVASDLPSLRDVLQHESNALLVNPEDPQAFALAIRRLIENPELAQRLGLQAHQDVEQYSWDSRAARLLDVIAMGNAHR